MKTDRRSKRSQKWMQDALMELMQELPYHKISVSKITERADIARPTFYLHFKTVDELLLSCINILFLEFTGTLTSFLEKNPKVSLELIHMVLDEFEKQKELIENLIKAGKEYFLLEQFQKYVGDLTPFVLDKIQVKFEPTLLQYLTDYFTGCLFTVLKRWMEEGMIQSKEVIAKFLYSMTEYNVKHAIQGKYNKIFSK